MIPSFRKFTPEAAHISATRFNLKREEDGRAHGKYVHDEFSETRRGLNHLAHRELALDGDAKHPLAITNTLGGTKRRRSRSSLGRGVLVHGDAPLFLTLYSAALKAKESHENKVVKNLSFDERFGLSLIYPKYVELVQTTGRTQQDWARLLANGLYNLGDQHDKKHTQDYIDMVNAA